MNTRVVSITQEYDFYVGPPVTGSARENVREGSTWAAGYIRHQGAADWRDVQAQRYFNNVIKRLLTDHNARAEAKMMRGRVLGARGEQGIRCARILAWLIDNASIAGPPGDSFKWREGFGDWLRNKSKPAPRGSDYQNGAVAAARVMTSRNEVCGVPEDFEDVGGTDETGWVF